MSLLVPGSPAVLPTDLQSKIDTVAQLLHEPLDAPGQPWGACCVPVHLRSHYCTHFTLLLPEAPAPPLPLMTRVRKEPP